VFSFLFLVFGISALNCTQETEFTVGPGESGCLGPWRKHHFSRLPEIQTKRDSRPCFIAFIGLWSKWSSVSCNLKVPSLKLTFLHLKNRMVGSDYFPFCGPAYFQGIFVGCREGIPRIGWWSNCPTRFSGFAPHSSLPPRTLPNLGVSFSPRVTSMCLGLETPGSWGKFVLSTFTILLPIAVGST